MSYCYSLLAATAVVIAVTVVFRWKSSKNQFEVDGQTVLLTGGSDGMGKSVGIQLAQKGANIIVVARDKVKLARAVEEFETVAKNPSQKFSSISADLTSDEATENMFQEAIASNDGRSPDIVFCCAGNCVPGFFVNSQMKTLRSQMDTVYWTAANTAHAALKRWLKPVAATDRQEEFVQTHSLPRHLIFTASTICFAPVAGYAPYSAPKAAMRALADTLHQETEVFNAVRRSGKHDAPERDVNVHIIFPMGISSPGYENEQRVKPELTKQLEEADHPQTPAEVARASIKGLERGEFMITTMLIGAVMKASAMGTSGRDHLFWDMALGAISNMVFPAVIWDLNRKAWNWGKANGVPKPVTS